MSNELTKSHRGRSESSPAESIEQDLFDVPPVDIYETRDEIVLLADVPGATADGIDIRLENRELTLSARRPGQAASGELRYCEYEPASYRRSFTLGNIIDQSKVTASLANGVLVLRLPKVEEVRPRRIQVSTG